MAETRATAYDSKIEGNVIFTRFDAAQFSARIAGEVKGFDPLQFIDKKDVKKMDVFIQFAIAASQFAMDDCGLSVTEDIARRVGVFIASGIGGFSTIEREHLALIKGGPRRISPFFIPSALINLASGQVSIKYGFKGPNHSVVTACATGAHALGDAARLIQLEDADVMVAGGTESPVNRLSMAGLAAVRALSTGFNDMHFFANELKLPTLGYGPGGQNYHAIDERAKIKDLVESAVIYTDLLTSFAPGFPSRCARRRGLARR